MSKTLIALAFASFIVAPGVALAEPSENSCNGQVNRFVNTVIVPPPGQVQNEYDVPASEVAAFRKEIREDIRSFVCN